MLISLILAAIQARQVIDRDRSLPEFLDFLAYRLVSVYGESENSDTVCSTLDRSRLLRQAMSVPWPPGK